MSQRSERAAREIEALLRAEDLEIDPEVLRDILKEEFEGGDVECKATPVDSSVSQSDAAPTVQSAGAANPNLRFEVDYLKRYVTQLKAELDLRDKREAEVMLKWLKKLSDQIDEKEKLQGQLLDAKNKAYTDYREYVGLVSQNEALRREVEELHRKLSEGPPDSKDYFPFTPKDWPT
jgi:hypothetical protein